MTEIMEIFHKMLKQSPVKSKRQLVKVLNTLIEGERDHYFQRKPYERKSGLLEDTRNGFKSRSLPSRFGSFCLRKPQTIKGVSNSLFERFQSSESVVNKLCGDLS
jgi:hypothetical protein